MCYGWRSLTWERQSFVPTFLYAVLAFDESPFCPAALIASNVFDMALYFFTDGRPWNRQKLIHNGCSIYMKRRGRTGLNAFIVWEPVNHNNHTWPQNVATFFENFCLPQMVFQALQTKPRARFHNHLILYSQQDQQMQHMPYRSNLVHVVDIQ